MGNLREKLESLGLLHDSAVQRLIWNPDDNSIEFVVEDFYSNFEGRPEYPGLVGGSIILSQIQHVGFEIEYEEKHLFIYEFQIDDTCPGQYGVTVLFRPSGRMQVVCGQVEFPELQIPDLKSSS